MERVTRTAVKTVYTQVDDHEWDNYHQCAECGLGPDALSGVEYAVSHRPGEIVLTYVSILYRLGCEHYCADCAAEMERES